jgi:leucyl/phenylalanyl-tRNA--protein transferase
MKRTIVFPPVEDATEDGLVAVGGDLEVDTLVTAYRSGIFPWPISADLPLAWFSPDPRGVLELSELHLPRSFRKFLKTHEYRVSFNEAFPEVIRSCARIARPGQPGTWITPEIIDGFTRLHREGLAYSVEVWEGQELLAGVYGVSMGEFFSGESMFTRVDNGSKLALQSLAQRLAVRGVRYLDTQMVTPVVEHFGGKFIPRKDFLRYLQTVDWDRRGIL